MEKKRYAIVILGASGDLAKRKLIPALHRLYQKDEIDESAAIVGSGRTEFTDEQFRNHCEAPAGFASMLFYHRGISGLQAYLSAKGDFSRTIIFMSLPPGVYASTAAELAAEGFGGEACIIIEKPFGWDYTSSVELNAELGRYFAEPCIFRSDHYLAKEAVQNILVFRFANALFYPLWSGKFIESIQINATERQGIGTRGAYFDKAGILKDMVQNHLLQMLCLLTMEAPLSLRAEDISAKKIDVLRSITVEQCHRCQYTGYREEKDVAEGSTTETFAELKLRIDNFRWSGVPVYMRSGKALDRTGTEIGVRFKPLPDILFQKYGGSVPNAIVFMIQPEAGIILSMASKESGNELKLAATNMTMCYHSSFDKEIPEAYQRLLLDAIHGDHTLFVNAQETEQAWRILEPVLDTGPVDRYERGASPPSMLGAQWLDFEDYCLSCALPEGKTE